MLVFCMIVLREYLPTFFLLVVGFVHKELLTYFEMLLLCLPVFPSIYLYVRLFGSLETQELQLQTKVLLN